MEEAVNALKELDQLIVARCFVLHSLRIGYDLNVQEETGGKTHPKKDTDTSEDRLRG
jgi:hypothetical protein